MINIPQTGDRISYFGRVSTPKQKLEHQWETVSRWCEQHALCIPAELRFEDKIRRHEAASILTDWQERKAKPPRKRYRFDELMKLVEARAIDWIVISTFDRWGVSDRDEIFVFRKMLRKYDVQLYSVVDSLNITAADETTFLHVAVKAVACTGYVTQQAEKNIGKMVAMAQAGYATTGNAPFGLDLVLYPLHDLTRPMWRVVRTRFKPAHFRVIYYKDTSRVERDANTGFITAARLEVEREELTPHMPLRDKKTTGYRVEPSVEESSLAAVRQIFELYDQGMGFAAISMHLWQQGLGHYGKAFGYHGVESVLSNSSYIGLPAWGKVGVGEYRLCIDKQPVAPSRKSTDPLVMKKAEDQFIYPLKPVIPPVVAPALFDSVKVKLQARPHVNESFGKRRTRDKAHHPLNGKLHCPDCDQPMVLGSFMPGKKSMERSRGKAKMSRCFHCGTWRKTNRAKCYANTVRWETLDAATDELLKVVADRIDTVKQGDLTGLMEAEWLKKSELGTTILGIIYAVLGKGHYPGDGGGTTAIHGYLTQKLHVETEFTLEKVELEDGILDSPDACGVFSWAFDFYDREFAAAATDMKAELVTINEELDAIAAELPIQRRKNQSMAERLDKRAVELDSRKAKIEPQLIPMTEKARATLKQLASIQDTILAADKTKVAALLDSFIERVYPVFDVKVVGPKKKRRTEVVGYRFIPKESAAKVLSEEMKIGVSRTHTGSSPRQEQSAPERSSSAALARW